MSETQTAQSQGNASSKPEIMSNGIDEYPNPTPNDLENPIFNAIWGAIKGWDISRHNDGMYSGPTGNDAMHIVLAIRKTFPMPLETCPECYRAYKEHEEWCSIGRNWKAAK